MAAPPGDSGRYPAVTPQTRLCNIYLYELIDRDKAGRIVWREHHKTAFKAHLARYAHSPATTDDEGQLRQLCRSALGLDPDTMAPPLWAALRRKILSSLAYHLGRLRSEGVLRSQYDRASASEVFIWPDWARREWSRHGWTGNEAPPGAGSRDDGSRAVAEQPQHQPAQQPRARRQQTASNVGQAHQTDDGGDMVMPAMPAAANTSMHSAPPRPGSAAEPIDVGANAPGQNGPPATISPGQLSQSRWAPVRQVPDRPVQQARPPLLPPAHELLRQPREDSTLGNADGTLSVSQQTPPLQQPQQHSAIPSQPLGSQPDPIPQLGQLVGHQQQHHARQHQILYQQEVENQSLPQQQPALPQPIPYVFLQPPTAPQQPEPITPWKPPEVFQQMFPGPPWAQGPRASRPHPSSTTPAQSDSCQRGAGSRDMATSHCCGCSHRAQQAQSTAQIPRPPSARAQGPGPPTQQTPALAVRPEDRPPLLAAPDSGPQTRPPLPTIPAAPPPTPSSTHLAPHHSLPGDHTAVGGPASLDIGADAAQTLPACAEAATGPPHQEPEQGWRGGEIAGAVHSPRDHQERRHQLAPIPPLVSPLRDSINAAASNVILSGAGARAEPRTEMQSEATPRGVPIAPPTPPATTAETRHAFSRAGVTLLTPESEPEPEYGRWRREAAARGPEPRPSDEKGGLSDDAHGYGPRHGIDNQGDGDPLYEREDPPSPSIHAATAKRASQRQEPVQQDHLGLTPPAGGLDRSIKKHVRVLRLPPTRAPHSPPGPATQGCSMSPLRQHSFDDPRASIPWMGQQLLGTAHTASESHPGLAVTALPTIPAVSVHTDPRLSIQSPLSPPQLGYSPRQTAAAHPPATSRGRLTSEQRFLGRPYTSPGRRKESTSRNYQLPESPRATTAPANDPRPRPPSPIATPSGPAGSTRLGPALTSRPEVLSVLPPPLRTAETVHSRGEAGRLVRLAVNAGNRRFARQLKVARRGELYLVGADGHETVNEELRELLRRRGRSVSASVIAARAGVGLQ